MPTPSQLTPKERTRYARHLVLPDFGAKGQERLKASSVLCVGAGGLGSPAIMYLAAAGVGKIGIADADTVDISNIQRQLLHGTGDIGRKKTESAAEAISDLNPHVELKLHTERLTVDNAMGIAKPYDLILDGTDNFPTRYLCNDVSVLLGKPNVHGSIFRFEGQVSVFAPHLGGPCYRCLFPDPPEPGAVPDWVDGGVLGVLPGVIGTLQATEAIKLLAGIGEPLLGRLLHYDALSSEFRTFKLQPDPQCPVCGENPSISEPQELPGYCSSPEPAKIPSITVSELNEKIIAETKPAILDVRQPEERAVCRIDGTLAIPLGELPDRLGELPATGELYVHCKSGMRSAKAVGILIEARSGERAINVEGGIDAWRELIDPSLPMG